MILSEGISNRVEALAGMNQAIGTGGARKAFRVEKGL